LKICRLVCEGAEEMFVKKNREFADLTIADFNDIFKHKYFYVTNVSTIFKMDQVDGLFKRLLDDSKPLSEKEQCILNRSKDGGPFTVFLELLRLKSYDYHFENVVQDVNPLNSWQVLKDRKRSAVDTLKIKKAPKMDLLELDPSGNHDKKVSEEFLEPEVHDANLEIFLQKRFLSPRIPNEFNLPLPYILHTMDFSKMLNFLDFCMKFGICHDSIEIFYKKYCANYSEELSGSSADFENFKNYAKEFLHVLAYKHTKSFRNSLMFCGFDVRKLNAALFGLLTHHVLDYSDQTRQEVQQDARRVLPQR
jgi:hypothetical protein